MRDIGAILGQIKDKCLQLIYYVSHGLNRAKSNYATIERKSMVIVYYFDKFRSYLLGLKVIVYRVNSYLPLLYRVFTEKKTM